VIAPSLGYYGDDSGFKLRIKKPFHSPGQHPGFIIFVCLTSLRTGCRSERDRCFRRSKSYKHPMESLILKGMQRGCSLLSPILSTGT